MGFMESSELVSVGAALLLLLTRASGAELSPQHTRVIRPAQDGKPALCQTTTGGTSMLPTLPLERIPIVYEVVKFSELRKGDIVIYNHATWGATTHRIFKLVSATEWWAKGDHNRLPDSDYVTPRNFVGRVLLQAKPDDSDSSAKSEAR